MDKNLKTTNKGEWAEFYTYLKILVDKVIVKGDKNLNPDYSVTYPVLKIFKNLNKNDIIAFLVSKNGFTLLDSNKEEVFFDDNVINSKLKLIFESILNSGDNFDGYTISDKLSLPVKNKTKTKADIKLQINDSITNTNPILSYSIKSKLTAFPTLVNASLATRFRYLINGELSDQEILNINSITGSRKVRERIKIITEKGLKITYVEVKSDKFKSNLKHIDSQFEDILGNLLLFAYFGKKDVSTIVKNSDFLDCLKNLKINSQIIENKIKEFLIAFALGMEPVKKWNGLDDLNGGIIWVKKDGSIVCHNLYERKELKDYLYENTFFESPSTTRHRYGFIYKENNNLYIDLCLQIRFY